MLMKKIFILLFAFLLFSCEQSEKRSLNNYPVDTVAAPIEEVTVPVKKEPTIHYSFVVFVTEEPVLMEQDHLQRGQKRYITEVETVNDTITEDYKYRELDAAEADLRDAELTETEKHYRSLADIYKINPLAAQVDILSRDIFIFDTYKDASIKRQEILKSKLPTNQTK